VHWAGGWALKINVERLFAQSVIEYHNARGWSVIRGDLTVSELEE
jgi:hypothetical protein